MKLAAEKIWNHYHNSPAISETEPLTTVASTSSENSSAISSPVAFTKMRSLQVTPKLTEKYAQRKLDMKEVRSSIPSI